MFLLYLSTDLKTLIRNIFNSVMQLNPIIATMYPSSIGPKSLIGFISLSAIKINNTAKTDVTKIRRETYLDLYVPIFTKNSMLLLSIIN